MAALPVAPRLYQDVEHVAVLVHRSPEILLPTLDVHEQLVEMPGVAHPTPPAPERPRVDWTERATPLPNRLVGDRDGSLG